MPSTSNRFRNIRVPLGSDIFDVPTHMKDQTEDLLNYADSKSSLHTRSREKASSGNTNWTIPRDQWINPGFTRLDAPTWTSNTNYALVALSLDLNMVHSGLGTANDHAYTGIIAVAFTKRTIGGGDQAWTGNNFFHFTVNGTNALTHTTIWHTYNWGKNARVEFTPKVYATSGWTPVVTNGWFQVHFLEMNSSGTRTLLAPEMTDVLHADTDTPPPPPQPTTYVEVAPDGTVTQKLTDLAWLNRIADKPAEDVTEPTLLGDGSKATFDHGTGLWVVSP